MIVDAPKTPFQPEEVAKLRAYADRGGRLLVIAGNAEKTGLEEFLKSFNVEIGPGLVVDPRWNYNRRVQVVFAPIAGAIRHPIVDSLANRAVLLPYAAPIRIRNAVRDRPAGQSPGAGDPHPPHERRVVGRDRPERCRRSSGARARNAGR